VVAHEQTRALGIIGKPSDDELGVVGLPLSFDGKRPPPLHAAHDIGADDDKIGKALKARR
ncbi:CoA transferase, partial [Streptomyces sp. SID89]|nr:CoA transferase [Streptomyces sp. SID89]